MKNENFEAIYEKAWAAGVAAATATVPTPMALQNAGLTGAYDPNRAPDYVVMEGPCGFAWVQTPANTPFGRWLKKTGKARKGYPTGLTIWISNYNQSMMRKEAHAAAMASVLREAGINCYANSRMD